MYKHILLAIDFSNHSKITAEKAKVLAKQFNARLTLLHVVEALPAGIYTYIDYAEIEDQIIAEAKKSLQTWVNQLGLSADQAHLKTGYPKTVIPEYAKEEKCDLIVIGSHGHSGLATVFGSTAAGIINHAPCDITVVRLAQ